MSGDRAPGKWFDLGGGTSDPAPSQTNRFPSLPNINIPGMRRQEVRSFGRVLLCCYVLFL